MAKNVFMTIVLAALSAIALGLVFLFFVFVFSHLSIWESSLIVAGTAITILYIIKKASEPRQKKNRTKTTSENT